MSPFNATCPSLLKTAIYNCFFRWILWRAAYKNCVHSAIPIIHHVHSFNSEFLNFPCCCDIFKQKLFFYFLGFYLSDVWFHMRPKYAAVSLENLSQSYDRFVLFFVIKVWRPSFFFLFFFLLLYE